MEVSATPLTFAPDGNGVVRHVAEVENGLACGCVCPACGAKLIAKQGPVTVHHFAHEGDSDCRGAGETSLHLAAKAILEKERRMLLPAVEERAEASDASGRRHVAQRFIPSKLVPFDSVSAEVRLGGVIPDIVATVGGRTLLVEVAVSHFADPGKASLLAERGLAAVEIDLSGMVDGWSWPSLKAAVVEQASCKKWLFNPKSARLRAEALREAEALASQADRSKLARDTRIRASQEFQRSRVPGFLTARQRLAEFLSPERTAEERSRMEAEGPTIAAWQSASRMLGVKWDRLPAHLNVPVPGELGSLVERRVWQGALFALFIRCNKNKTFTARSAATWCVNTFGWRTEFAVLYKHEHLLTNEERQNLPYASKAVDAYLNALEEFGFIARKGERYEILRRSAS